MSETRNVFPRRPFIAESTVYTTTWDDSVHEDGWVVEGEVFTENDFNECFIDADQYAAEQRDKVIRELMDRDVSVEPTERIDGTFYIWDDQNESAYDTIRDWLKSQLTNPEQD